MKKNVQWMVNLAAMPVAVAIQLVAMVGHVGAAHGQCGQWHPLDNGTNGTVLALTIYNGDLIVAGDFTEAGGQVVNFIARWDGSTWHPLASGGQVGVGGGVDNAVRAVTVYNGHLVAGGSFLTAGGQTVNRIARWDGSAWHPFEVDGVAGVSASVNALAVWGDELIVGGGFTFAGGQTMHRVARWIDAAGIWQPFVVNDVIGVNAAVLTLRALDTPAGSDLLVGGSFTVAGPTTVNRIARWSVNAGVGAWQPFVDTDGTIGVTGFVRTFAPAQPLYTGGFLVGGSLTSAGSATVNRIARWDDSAGLDPWHAFESEGVIGVNNDVRAIVLYNDDVIVAGDFSTAGPHLVNRIVRWRAAEGIWQPFIVNGNVGVSSFVRAMIVFNGELIVGGAFGQAGGTTVSRIARWVDCPTPSCPGDLTGSGSVGVPALLALLACWGPVVPGNNCEEADLSASGAVGVPDLLQLLGAWGACP